ncbi:MAG: hypothetical protein ACREB9_02670 [Thermoplasmata archaeon]
MSANKWALGVYVVTLSVEKLTGGIPKNPDLIKGWLAGRGVTLGVEPVVKGEAEKLGGQAVEEGSWKGFYLDGKGLFFEARNVRGMLKQAARANGGTKRVKAALKKLTDNLLIEPARIYPTKADGDTFHEPTESEERAVHVMTPQGPRTALKKSDILRGATIRFSLTTSHPDLTQEFLGDLLDYGQFFLGIGSDVSQGDGKYVVEKFEKVN